MLETIPKLNTGSQKKLYDILGMKKTTIFCVTTKLSTCIQVQDHKNSMP